MDELVNDLVKICTSIDIPKHPNNAYSEKFKKNLEARTQDLLSSVGGTKKVQIDEVMEKCKKEIEKLIENKRDTALHLKLYQKKCPTPSKNFYILCLIFLKVQYKKDC